MYIIGDGKEGSCMIVVVGTQGLNLFLFPHSVPLSALGEMHSSKQEVFSFLPCERKRGRDGE